MLIRGLFLVTENLLREIFCSKNNNSRPLGSRGSLRTKKIYSVMPLKCSLPGRRGRNQPRIPHKNMIEYIPDILKKYLMDSRSCWAFPAEDQIWAFIVRDQLGAQKVICGLRWHSFGACEGLGLINVRRAAGTRLSVTTCENWDENEKVGWGFEVLDFFS